MAILPRPRRGCWSVSRRFVRRVLLSKRPGWDLERFARGERSNRAVSLPYSAHHILPRQESFASLHILTRRASEGSEALPSLARRVSMSFFGARVIERRSSDGETHGTVPHRRESSREQAWHFPPDNNVDTYKFIVPARQFVLRRFHFLFSCLGCPSEATRDARFRAIPSASQPSASRRQWRREGPPGG